MLHDVHRKKNNFFFHAYKSNTFNFTIQKWIRQGIKPLYHSPKITSLKSLIYIFPDFFLLNKYQYMVGGDLCMNVEII